MFQFNAMKTNLYIILGLSALIVALFFVSGYFSAPGTSSSQSSSNNSFISGYGCDAYNLAFTYNSTDSLKAPSNTNTFGIVYVTNVGNVTDNISITGAKNSNLNILFAKSFSAPVGQKSYTEYEFAMPSPGNYTENMTLTALYNGCKLSKSFLVYVQVTSNSTS